MSLELQGDIEGSCEVTETRHICDKAQESVTTLYTVCRMVLNYIHVLYNTCIVHIILAIVNYQSGSNGGRHSDKFHCPSILHISMWYGVKS